MEKQDARKLTPEAVEQLRRQAVGLRNKQMTYAAIAEILGVHPNTVAKWCLSFKKHGKKALKPKTKGVKHGTNRTLTPEQEADIQKCIVDKTPDQYKLNFALWTRQAIRELIKLRTGITMPIRTVGGQLERWGYTPQKPLKRAYEQRPEAVRKWLEEDYPAIQQKAKEENAEIHWGDETGIRSDSQHGRSYSPKGKTPEIRLNAQRRSINMISSITNKGKVRFMMYEGTFDAKRFIKFLIRLCKEAGRKIYLILDNLKVHHAKIAQAWLDKHKGQIEVFFLPSYSPELNPDEYLNCDLKGGVHSRPPARSQQELKDNVFAHMRMLQKHPERVANYYKHPKIRYAA
jgi:transposase